MHQQNAAFPPKKHRLNFYSWNLESQLSLTFCFQQKQVSKRQSNVGTVALILGALAIFNMVILANSDPHKTTSCSAWPHWFRCGSFHVTSWHFMAVDSTKPKTCLARRCSCSQASNTSPSMITLDKGPRCRFWKFFSDRNLYKFYCKSGIDQFQ